MARGRTILWAGTALVAAPLAAQPDAPVPAPCGEIVVTAPTPLSDTADRPPLPAQRTTAADIAAAHATDLTDYLKRMVGGVYVNEVQGNPLQPDIGYRGFTASPLLGTPQGLSVYLDGVRLNQPFGDVVSWDLIPKSAIRTVTLVPGSDPLFGRNSLGGALSIQTKDGASDPGYRLEGSYGAFRRRTGAAQGGGALGHGVTWFASGDYFAEHGWRDASPSRAGQAFAKLAWSDDATAIALSGAHADTRLTGNGLQDGRLLAADRASIYTKPDTTRNGGDLANLTLRHRLSDALTLSGNLFWRRIATRTYNGDLNDDALGQAAFDGTAGCTAAALAGADPDTRCNGLVNRSATRQHEAGGSGEATWTAPALGGTNRLTMGATLVASRAHFVQSSEFGSLTADRGVIGGGVFADGDQGGDDAFDARVDLTGTTLAASLYALDALDLTRTLHLDVSARYDHSRVRDADRITPGGGSGSLDGTHRFAKLNPAVALRWTASRRLALDLAATQASRAPSAIELGCSDPDSPCRLPNALAGDPPLAQVVARTIESGATVQAGAWRLRAGLFRTVSLHDILFVSDDVSGYGYFRNFGRTRRQGIDLDLAGRAGPFTIAAHYSLVDATYRSAETVDGSANSSNDGPALGFGGAIAIARGDRIPLVPRHIGKASVTWQPSGRFQLTADMIASGGIYARGNENDGDRADGVYYLGPGRTAAYAVFNLGGELHPTAHLTVFAQCDNLFGARYATAAQLSATGFDAAGRFVAQPFAGPVIDGARPLLSATFYTPGAPRAVQLGARIAF